MTALDLSWFTEFVRDRGLAVLATNCPGGPPESALVGIALSGDGDILFDTSICSRKFRNLQADPQVSMVIGLGDEITAQCAGTVEVLSHDDREGHLPAYLELHPDGADRAADPDIVLLRLRISWLRISDYRGAAPDIREHEL